jgi:hypothetical protein
MGEGSAAVIRLLCALQSFLLLMRPVRSMQTGRPPFQKAKLEMMNKN